MGYANKNQIKVILIQDYYHYEDKIWSIPTNWQSFTSIKQTAAIIVTRKDIKGIQTYNDENSVFVNITTTTGTITVGSAYSRPKAFCGGHAVARPF